MRIQHNIPAMSSYRNYSRNVSAVNKNLEKLSSGYRINRAGDDAAGLAISEKMRLQISGLEQAQNNAKSGINLVQTAEGALTEVHDMLNRMYTLAEQSANGTYSDDVDREQLQKEVDSLRKEIDRIADATNYNGIKLLDGSLDNGATAAVKGETKSFEIGGDGAGALPAVDNTKINAAGGTVLHKGASADETENAFGVEFHSAKIEGDKDDTFTLTIGDLVLTGTLTGTAQGDTAITADDLVDALAGDGSDKFTLKVGADDYNKDEIAINGGKFAVTESGTGKGVIFTQTDEAELTGGVAMDVTLAAGNDEEPTGGQAPTVTETADTAGTDVTGAFKDNGAATTATPTATSTANAGTLDFTNTTANSAQSKAGSTITFSIGGEDFTVTLKNGDADADEVTAGTQIDIAGKAMSDVMALAVDAANKQITARNATKANDAGHANYAEFGQLTAGNVTGADDGTITITGTVSSQNKTWDATLGGSEAKATVDFTGKTGADVIGSSITIDGKTYLFYKTGGTAPTGDGVVGVAVAEDADADALADALVTAADKDNGGTAGDNVGSVAEDGVDSKKVVFTGKVKGTDQTLETSASSTENVEVAVSGQWNWKTTDQNLKAEAGEELLAQTSFTLTAEMAADGAKIRFGETEYTFTTDAAKKGDEGMVYVGDLDLTDDDDLAVAAQRLTDAAAGNDTWSVAQKSATITLTEQVGYTQADNSQKYDLSTEEGIEESLGFTTATTAATEGDPNKGLTLQIGDTAESFNKLNVSVKDMHAAGLKIDGIDISTQAGASAAMEKIKAATNMVSDVRGSLGALQNRLDHTINNLSVTQENIQDAESTIRDVDIAKEMMAYTKNNILVQSAQAMLAQANQLPQGVLQLLG